MDRTEHRTEIALHRSIAAVFACLTVAGSVVVITRAAQGQERPGATAKVEREPERPTRPAAWNADADDALAALPASIREQAWMRTIYETAMTSSLVYHESALEFLRRVKEQYPEFADRVDAAVANIREIMTPGVDSMIQELRQRNKDFDKELAKIRARVEFRIAEVELKPAEIERDFEVARWDPERFPTKYIAPSLAFDPRSLTDPAWIMNADLGMQKELTSTDGSRTLVITVPRTWTPNEQRAPSEVAFAMFSDLGFGPCALMINPLTTVPPERDASAVSIFEFVDKLPAVDGHTKRSSRIEWFGDREVALIISDFEEPCKEVDRCMRMVSAYWAQDGLFIESAWTIQATRGKDEPFPIEEFDAAWEHYRPLFDAMAASARVEVVEKKPGEPEKPESDPSEPTEPQGTPGK